MDRNNVLIGMVETGTNQVIHAGINDDKLLRLPFLGIQHLADHDPGIAHQRAPGFHNQNTPQIPDLIQHRPGIFRRQRRLFIIIPDAQSAADIQIMDIHLQSPQFLNQQFYPFHGISERAHLGQLRANVTVDADNPDMGQPGSTLIKGNRPGNGNAEFIGTESG